MIQCPLSGEFLAKLGERQSLTYKGVTGLLAALDDLQRQGHDVLYETRPGFVSASIGCVATCASEDSCGSSRILVIVSGTKFTRSVTIDAADCPRAEELGLKPDDDVDNRGEDLV